MSPTLNVVTRAPISTTCPTASWPNISGYFSGPKFLKARWISFASVPLQTPQLSVFTSAWHSLNGGMDTSLTASAPSFSTISVFTT